MKRGVVWCCQALASCFFLSYPLERLARRFSRHQTGAGLIGSLAGLACVRFLPQGTLACLLTLLGIFFISVVISDIAEESLGQKDDQRIIIDEWLGYLISVALLPTSIAVLLTALVLFRLLDSWKPLRIKRLALLPGGWGIVMDDVVAGLITNLLLRVFRLAA